VNWTDGLSLNLLAKFGCGEATNTHLNGKLNEDALSIIPLMNFALLRIIFVYTTAVPKVFTEVWHSYGLVSSTMCVSFSFARQSDFFKWRSAALSLGTVFFFNGN